MAQRAPQYVEVGAIPLRGAEEGEGGTWHIRLVTPPTAWLDPTGKAGARVVTWHVLAMGLWAELLRDPLPRLPHLLVQGVVLPAPGSNKIAWRTPHDQPQTSFHVWAERLDWYRADMPAGFTLFQSGATPWDEEEAAWEAMQGGSFGDDEFLDD